MDTCYFDLLPDPQIIEIALYLSLHDIPQYCRINSRFNNLICNNEIFWRLKFHKDYDKTRPVNYTVNSWKSLYMNFNNVWTFGSNIFGRSGFCDNQHRNIPTQIYNLKAKQISIGKTHTLVIDINNNVWTFGNNLSGQLGLGDFNNRNTPIQIPNLKGKQISAGLNHTVVIDLNDNVWIFGSNVFGQLGLGNNQQDRIRPTKIPNIKAKQISAGRNHTVLIDLNDNMDIWI